MKKTETSPKPKKKPTQSKIQLMLVDDHSLFRSGLRRVLELEPDMDIIAEVADGAAAVEQARALKPNVILMDVNLPTLNGLQATRELTLSRIESGIIILTAYHDDDQMLHAMRSGASAYFPKDVDAHVLIRAIRAVSKGSYVVNDAVLAKPQIAAWLLNQFEQVTTADVDSSESTFRPLSTRETEILKLITRGQSNKEIAQLLGISRQTVKNHMTSILRKLAVNDRTQAAVYALRHGWIRLEDAH